MSSIKLENVDKVYPNGHVAVRGVDLDVADGELVVLVGPSGSGKTTILRMVAGLETPTQGRVFLDGDDVTVWPPQKRNLAMVFQSFSLYPHKTVRDNLAFGLRLRRAPAALIAERVAKVAQTLGLESLLDRKPGQLSGGERQRVALGRAIVRQPRAFLLDEPLSNLDAQLREQTRGELARLHRQLGATMLYVTHDQTEAMILGDRVAVLREGVVQQVAAPLEIEQRPVNAFVAGFIGSPPMNFFSCTLRTEAGIFLKSPWFELSLDGGNLRPVPNNVLLGVRPYHVCLAESAQADAVAPIEAIQRVGNQQVVRATLTREMEQAPVTLVLPAELSLSESQSIGIRFQREHLHLFDAKSGQRLN